MHTWSFSPSYPHTAYPACTIPRGATHPAPAHLPDSAEGAPSHEPPRSLLTQLGPQNHTPPPRHLVRGQVLPWGQGSAPRGDPSWGQTRGWLQLPLCAAPCGSEPAQPFRLLRPGLKSFPRLSVGWYRQQLGCFLPCRTQEDFFLQVGGLLPVSTASHAGHHVPVMLPHKVLRCLPRSGKALVLL